MWPLPVSVRARIFGGRAWRAVARCLGYFRLIKQVKRRRYFELLDAVRRRYPRSRPGDAAWLAGKELEYGGLVHGVERRRVSPIDPRSGAQIRRGGMTGGDRMLFHGYADKYAEHLAPFIARKAPVTLAEFGILNGTGLAIWCDLFPEGRVLGFDIDPEHFLENRPALESLGAFRQNQPEVHELDQFEDNADRLGAVLEDDRIDVGIDDGFHSVETILRTFESVRRHLASDFVYFAEDNPLAVHALRAAYPELDVESAGDLTILRPRR